MWRQYSCLLEEDAKVLVTSCNAGRGCYGDMFLHSMAKNLFSSKKGSIESPTSYAAADIFGVIPPFSINGKKRKLSYDPEKKPREKWTQTGIAISDGGTMASHCRDEIKELIASVNLARLRAKGKKCELSTFYLGEDKLKSYQTLANGLSDNQTWNYTVVEKVIYQLETQLETLYRCRRPSDGRRNKNGKRM